MARAGFWPIGGYTISFRTDGRWYADDEVIANPKIARLFSRHVQYDEEDGWQRERLFQPDVELTMWRQFASRHARGIQTEDHAKGYFKRR